MTTKSTKREKPEEKGFLEKLGERLDHIGIWHKRVLAIIAIIGSLAGAVITISNNLNAALDSHITAQTDRIAGTLEQQSTELSNIRLDTLRTQLLMYMYHEPTAHDTILKLGYAYFVEYQGDWVMTNKFKEWADEQEVNVPFDLTH